MMAAMVDGARGGRFPVAGRALPVAQAIAGTLFMTRPDQVARAASGTPRGAPAPWIVRLLGIRLLAQGIAASVWPRPRTAVLSAAIDATHSASMVVAGALSPRFRRAALISASISLGSAFISTLAATSPRPSQR
jgi:hypothetical protein